MFPPLSFLRTDRRTDVLLVYLLLTRVAGIHVQPGDSSVTFTTKQEVDYELFQDS